MKSKISKSILKRLAIPCLIAIILVSILVSTSIFSSPQVASASNYLSLSVGTTRLQSYIAPPQAPELSDWTIQFNPSGTHVKDGYLKIRLDFYPSQTSKNYSKQLVSAPIVPVDGYLGKMKDGVPADVNDYTSWLGSLPKSWQLNPALCHFITISENITIDQLQAYITQTFTADTVATIDNALILPNASHLVSPYMVDKVFPGTKVKITKMDTKKLVEDTNKLLEGFTVLGSGIGIPKELIPESIDIGPGATDRNGQDAPGHTFVPKDNPADGTGIISTWQLWFDNQYSNAAGVKVATFFVVSGNNLSTRDYETIGAVTKGSIQTFTGLSTDVVTGDYAGLYCASGGYIEVSSTGSGVWYYLYASKIPCTNTAFSSASNLAYSIYGTGGAATAIPTVLTGSASSITTVSASCSENVTAVNGANVTSRGTQYGTTTAYGSNVTTADNQGAAFSWSDALSSLSPNTLYYYRGFAVNSAGIGYGSSTNFTTLYLGITNSPIQKAFGVVQPASVYYAKGNAPGNPVESGNCTFIITNTGTSTANITISSGNFSGGVGWLIVSGSPVQNQARITAYYTGQNPASGVILANSSQSFYNGLAASANITWDFKLETGSSFTDGVGKSATITLTAIAP